MTKRFTPPLCAGIFAALLGPSMVQANTQRCAAHDDIVARLATVYGERRQAIGLASGNTVIEVYASEESGSWSIMVTQPGGPTCLVAAGDHFQLEPPFLAAEDPDA